MADQGLDHSVYVARPAESGDHDHRNACAVHPDRHRLALAAGEIRALFTVSQLLTLVGVLALLVWDWWLSQQLRSRRRDWPSDP